MLISARPLRNERRRGADRGIDDVPGFVDGSGRRQRRRRVLVQVKSGHVGVGDIRDLRGVIEREDAPIGIFVTLEPPTGPMRREALEAGFFTPESREGRYPRVQILAIAELLAGAQVKMPLLRAAHRIDEESWQSEDLNTPPP